MFKMFYYWHLFRAYRMASFSSIIKNRTWKKTVIVKTNPGLSQWWILGEASEAVASGLPFIVIEGRLFENAAYASFCGILHESINYKNSKIWRF